MWEGFFTGYLNYGLNCREKIEEIISRNSLPHYKRASSFTKKREAAWLHLLPNLSRYRRMSESLQHAGSARHSTTGDVYCMRAVPVTLRQVMFTVCGQCPSLHAEGLIWSFCALFQNWFAGGLTSIKLSLYCVIHFNESGLEDELFSNA